MLKPRNIKTYGKIKEPKETKVGFMGYVASTGEYFISEEKDLNLAKEECQEWAEANGGKVLKQVRTVAYYEEIADGLWIRAKV